jgi:hypothetical protein
MLENRKRASVFLQSWFVFLLFLVFYNHYQTQVWWRNKATEEFTLAKETIQQHIEVIEMLRSNLITCRGVEEDCHVQYFETNELIYEVTFDLQNDQVIEINITNH